MEKLAEDIYHTREPHVCKKQQFSRYFLKNNLRNKGWLILPSLNNNTTF